MNSEFLIIRNIYEKKQVSQRDIASALNVSLGNVNIFFKEIKNKNYITNNYDYRLTKEGRELLYNNKVNTAIILADERLVKNSISTFIPIGLRDINEECLLEKNIKLLKEKNIDNIYIVAGNYIEAYEYLIDKYKINIIYDKSYDKKGTISKLLKVRDVCENNDAYILSSNIYLSENVFHEFEIESYIYGYYLDDLEDKWRLILNNKRALVEIEKGGEHNFAKTSIMFLKKKYSKDFFKLLNSYNQLSSASRMDYFEALADNLDLLKEFFVYKLKKDVYDEINNDYDFRKYDFTYRIKNRFPTEYVKRHFNVTEKNIIDAYRENYKNKSIFTFGLNRKEYEGKTYIINNTTEIEKISRNLEEEKKLYDEIKDNIDFEKVVYIDNDYNVIKEKINITKQFDINNNEDIRSLLLFFREMHNKNIKISRMLDLDVIIDKYILYMRNNNIQILYKDYYEQVKTVKSLIYYAKSYKRPNVLCKNFLDSEDVCITNEGIKLKNNEYVGLFDPLIDIAATCEMLNGDVDRAIDLFNEYNDVLDTNNIMMQNINKSIAKNILICFLSILYFLKATNIMIEQCINNMVNQYDRSYNKYRLYKKCIYYIMKNKII